jgi:hypothetical protein
MKQRKRLNRKKRARRVGTFTAEETRILLDLADSLCQTNQLSRAVKPARVEAGRVSMWRPAPYV